MIVTDEVMTQLKLTDFVTNSLSSTTEIKIFDKVEPNPSMTTIENGLKDFIDFEPQCIIALGGGSPIDACKAILYFSYELYKKLKVNKRIFFIAIPTTSGTGSEVTSYSVVTKGEHKIALANDLMLPDVALLSTKFLGALPAKVVADGPAARAGIQANDVIVAVNGKAVNSAGAFIGELAAKKVGESIF